MIGVLSNPQATRFYLKYSATFDYPLFVYHTNLYKKTIKEAGGKNVRTSYQFGWSNQPKVVTWTGTAEINQAIDKALSACSPFASRFVGDGLLPCPIIHDKDW